MLRSDSPKPLYEQIKDYILSHIHSGKWTHNTRIPSERDLAEQFDVSRVTAGKAIKELVRAGYLNVQIGKGTYVSDGIVKQQIETLTSFTEEMDSRGQATRSAVLKAQVVAAPEAIAEMLNLPVGIDIIQLERVRYAGKHPMAIELASVTASLCPNILAQHDFSRESLYAVLRDQYDVNLVAADQSFEARAATEHEAPHLAIAVGAPVLAVHRVTYNAAGMACEVVRSVYRGDRYTFRARLTRI